MKRRTRKRTCPALVRRARRRGYTCHPPALPPAHPLPQPPTQPPTWQATGPASQSHHHPHAAAAAPTTDGDQERAVRARGACAQCGWERGVHRHEGAGAGERDAARCTARGRARECNHPTRAPVGGAGESGGRAGRGGWWRVAVVGRQQPGGAWAAAGHARGCGCGDGAVGARARLCVRALDHDRPHCGCGCGWGRPSRRPPYGPLFGRARGAAPISWPPRAAADAVAPRPHPPPPHPPPRKYFIVPALVRWEVVAAHTPRRGLADALRG